MAEQGNFFRDSLARTLPGGQTGRQGPNTFLQMAGQGLGSLLFPGGGGVGGEVGERLGDTGFGRFVNNPMQGIRNFFGGNKPGYAGRDNTYTGEQGSNFVGPGQYQNTGGYGTTSFGGSPANSFLTGNFSPSQMSQGGDNAPLVNLNYGQNPQQYQMQGGGMLGITGPNPYAPAKPSGTSVSIGNSGNGNGTGGNWGGISMSQLENMLSAGMHDRAARMTPRREMSSDRAAMRQAGFEKMAGETPQQYRERAMQAGII